MKHLKIHKKRSNFTASLYIDIYMCNRSNYGEKDLETRDRLELQIGMRMFTLSIADDTRSISINESCLHLSLIK